MYNLILTAYIYIYVAECVDFAKTFKNVFYGKKNFKFKKKLKTYFECNVLSFTFISQVGPYDLNIQRSLSDWSV